jgi:hypothetical protein
MKQFRVSGSFRMREVQEAGRHMTIDSKKTGS